MEKSNQNTSSRKKRSSLISQHKGRREHFWFSLLVFIVGAALTTLGFYAPPAGEIHPSVLVAFGEALTFSGACLGIDYHYSHREYTHKEKMR